MHAADVRPTLLASYLCTGVQPVPCPSHVAQLPSTCSDQLAAVSAMPNIALPSDAWRGHNTHAGSTHARTPATAEATVGSLHMTRSRHRLNPCHAFPLRQSPSCRPPHTAPANLCQTALPHSAYHNCASEASAARPRSHPPPHSLTASACVPLPACP